MDLNEIPSDHIVIDPKMGGNGNIVLVADFDGLGESTCINDSEIVDKRKEEDTKCLALQIRNKCLELEEIVGKIRVLECERVRIEEEVKGLRKKKAVLEGAPGGGFSLEERNVGVESDEEVSKVGELMVENKVVECERSIAVQDVEEWKRKCEELELRVRELEGRLRCDGKDDILTEVKEVSKDDTVDGAARMFGSATYSLGGIQTEGTTSIGKNRKRQLDFFDEKSCNQKIAHCTPAEAGPSSASVIDIDSDHETDVPAQQGSPSGVPGVADILTDDISDEEDVTGGEGDDRLVKTRKRKHDLTVVTSDDKAVKNKAMLKRRAFIPDNSDNEGEDDDDAPKTKDDITVATSNDKTVESESMPEGLDKSDNEGEGEDDDDAVPLMRIFKRGKRNSENLDEDDIPISQLKMNSAQGTRRSVRLQEKKSPGRKSDGCSHIPTRPKRRLVKCGEKTENSPTSLSKKYIQIEESEEEDSGSDASLDDFIVDDNDCEAMEDALSDDGSHHSPEPEESSDSDLDLGKIMSTLQRSKGPELDWKSVGDMLSALGKDPELCMRAVCALYRRQTNEEMMCRSSLNQNGRGFSKLDAARGTRLGEFLTGGDPNGDLARTVEELREFDPEGLKVCETLAYHYCNQLFDIYETNEYRYFPG